MIKSPLLDMLASQMRYSTQRQSVLAQNIANIDTPGYKARDLKKVDFSQMVEKEAAPSTLDLNTTSTKHIGGEGSSHKYSEIRDRHTFETTPSGNSVVLEEEMAKVSETGAQYQIASSLFKKFTGLYRIAAGQR